MPGLNGLDVAAAALKLSPDTQVVFVTAYNQYAIDAFDKGAIDYLLKPVEPKRLAASILRLKARAISGVRDASALQALVEKLNQNLPARVVAEPLVWLTASTGKDSRLIMIEDVLYFQSDSKYTTVVTHEGEALLRTPLRDLIPRLDARQFKQIPPRHHRQHEGGCRHQPRRKRPRQHLIKGTAGNFDRQRDLHAFVQDHVAQPF